MRRLFESIWVTAMAGGLVASFTQSAAPAEGEFKVPPAPARTQLVQP